MVTVPHIMVGLERMLDYRGVGLARFYCSLTGLPSCGYNGSDLLFSKTNRLCAW